jgi:hypothetical protein
MPFLVIAKPHVRHASIIITSAKLSGRLIDTPMTARSNLNAVREHSVSSLPAYEKEARSVAAREQHQRRRHGASSMMLPPFGRARRSGRACTALAPSPAGPVPPIPTALAEIDVARWVGMGPPRDPLISKGCRRHENCWVVIWLSSRRAYDEETEGPAPARWKKASPSGIARMRPTAA